MSIQEGDKIPAATLHSMQDGKPTPMTTEDILLAKKLSYLPFRVRSPQPVQWLTCPGLWLTQTALRPKA